MLSKNPDSGTSGSSSPPPPFSDSQENKTHKKLPTQEQSAKEMPKEENPVVETPNKEDPIGENQTPEQETDKTMSGEGDKKLQEKRNPPGSVPKQENSKERVTSEKESQSQSQSQEKGDLCQEEEEGFDFQHLQVLQNMPVSAFYGVDLCDLSQRLKPSEICTFYGNDEDSLAAENARLDEFYAHRNRVQAVCENDMLLFPESRNEEDDDETTLMNLVAYKQEGHTLPYVLDQPLPILGEQHRLLVHINSYIKQGECIIEDRLTDKVLKLQIKYKNLVEEKGINPNDQDFTSSAEENFLSLSRLVWEQNQDSNVNPGGVNRDPNVHAKSSLNVEQEVAAKSKCEEAVSKDQDQEMFLFSKSTSEEEDEVKTLRTLLNYKEVAGILTSYDQTGATPGQQASSASFDKFL